MNYADEVLITGPGHLQPPGNAGPRGKTKNAEKIIQGKHAYDALIYSPVSCICMCSPLCYLSFILFINISDERDT